MGERACSLLRAVSDGPRAQSRCWLFDGIRCGSTSRAQGAEDGFFDQAHDPDDIGGQIPIGQQSSGVSVLASRPEDGQPKCIRHVARCERDFDVEVIDRETEEAQVLRRLSDGGSKAFCFHCLVQSLDQWEKGRRSDGAKLPAAALIRPEQIRCLPFTELAAEILEGRLR